MSIDVTGLLPRSLPYRAPCCKTCGSRALTVADVGRHHTRYGRLVTSADGRVWQAATVEWQPRLIVCCEACGEDAG